MFKCKIFLMILVAILLASCSTTPQYQDLSGSTQYAVLAFPRAVYDSLFWFKDNGLVAFMGFVASESKIPTRNDYGSEHNPYAVEDDSEIHDLQFTSNIESVGNCIQRKDYYPTTLLPDGRLGILFHCRAKLSETENLFMLAYSWDTKKIEKILNYPLPNPMRSGCFSWNPQMTSAIQGTYDGTTGSLYWLSLKGPEPLQLVLKDGNKSWDISKSYAGNGDSSEGLASCAGWSPDGEHILFFASLDAIGIGGFARMDAPSALYSYSVTTGKAEVLLSNFYHAGAIRWSPDGKMVAFQATLQSAQATSNIWVFRISDKKLFLITTAHLRDLAWSPDSKDIAGIWCDVTGCSTSEIRKYSFDLSVSK